MKQLGISSMGSPLYLVIFSYKHTGLDVRTFLFNAVVTVHLSVRMEDQAYQVEFFNSDHQSPI
jgi:hypothetical protein